MSRVVTALLLLPPLLAIILFAPAWAFLLLAEVMALLGVRELFELAEPIPGESTRVFSKLAKELGAVLIVPVFERAGSGNGKEKQARFYNSAVVIDERGRLLPTYRKLHLPQDPLFYEQNYFSRGNMGYRVYKTKFATFAVLICYDQWFPEAARMATLAG